MTLYLEANRQEYDLASRFAVPETTDPAAIESTELAQERLLRNLVLAGRPADEPTAEAAAQTAKFSRWVNTVSVFRPDGWKWPPDQLPNGDRVIPVPFNTFSLNEPPRAKLRLRYVLRLAEVSRYPFSTPHQRREMRSSTPIKVIGYKIDTSSTNKDLLNVAAYRCVDNTVESKYQKVDYLGVLRRLRSQRTSWEQFMSCTHPSQLLAVAQPELDAAQALVDAQNERDAKVLSLIRDTIEYRNAMRQRAAR